MRAVDLLLAKLNGEPYESEIPLIESETMRFPI